MLGYDNVVQNPCFKPMGPHSMEREMGRVQRAGGGFNRAGGADRVMVNRSGPNGQTGSSWVKGGRTRAGWTEADRTGDEWTVDGRPGAGWTEEGRPTATELGPGGPPMAEPGWAEPQANPTSSG
ncbi:unnamed protein product [Linum trigynum]|uniref:Uncharacterized protein n=1 Tax=Linum trigynum TaxID=586398 RepID=A0AAV2GP95_9ROSI